jgi:hypothetical protein
MADRPIMLRASQVANIINSRQYSLRCAPSHAMADCQIRDRLWVREAVRAAIDEQTKRYGVFYLAGPPHRILPDLFEWDRKWAELNAYRGGKGITVPALHMPKWASRLVLNIHDVVFQRLQDITIEDAFDEGVPRDATDPRGEFAALWDATALPDERWASNPEIARISFSPARMSIGE